MKTDTKEQPAITPLPWKVGAKITRFVYAADGTPICECESMAEASIVTERANAAFIVRACNAHQDILDALNVCLGHLTGGMDGDYRDCDPIELARTVLKKATQP